MRHIRIFIYCFEEAFLELWRNRLVNLISIGTIAVSLFILGVFASVSENLKALVVNLSDRVQLTLYLSEDCSDDDVTRLQADIKSLTAVDRFEFVSKDDAVSRFRSYFPELDTLPELLDTNPLPASFEIQVASAFREPAQVSSLAVRLSEMKGVAEVDYDMLWIERLSTIINLVQILGLALGTALVVASIFTIFNVIKLNVYGRQEEINIMRLVGATHVYIRGPFLVEGMLQGGLGGLAALTLLFGAHQLLLSQLQSLQLLGTDTWTQFLSPGIWAAIVLGGMSVGLIGSMLSVRKFLSSSI